MCNDIQDLTSDKEIINKVEKFEDFVRYNYDVEIISKNGLEVKSHKFSAKAIEISEAYDGSLNLDFDYIDTMGENGSLILSGLYLFGLDDKDIDERVEKFVEENKKHVGIFDYVFIDDKDTDFERECMISYNQGLKDGYLGCLLEILKNINVKKIRSKI